MPHFQNTITEPFLSVSLFENLNYTEFMNKEDLIAYIENNYGVTAEYPFKKRPVSSVFRHTDNQKWFALITNISKGRLGFKDTNALDIVNLKCDPALIGSLIMDDGFFPAYHMNKSNWISVALDGTVDKERIEMLEDLSFKLTAAKH